MGQRDVSVCPSAQKMLQGAQGGKGNEFLARVPGCWLFSGEAPGLVGSVSNALAQS